MKKRIVILISGRGSNMKAIVQNTKDGLLKGYCEVIEVFSNKKNAAGIKIAQKFGLPTKIIESKGKKKKTYNTLLLNHLKTLNLDYIILAGYMKILPPEIVHSFKNKIINIHPADTALYKGLHGYEWAFQNNLESTKITVHYVDEGVDTGPVIAKRKVDLRDCHNLVEVENQGLSVEHQFYSECLKRIFSKENCKKN